MRAQALGLARAIAKLSGFEVAEIEVRAPRILNLLPPSMASRLPFFGGGGKGARIVISCGTLAQPAALAMQRSGAFSVCVQRPRANETKFDAVIAPLHDYEESEIASINANPDSKTFLMLGAPGAISADALSARRAAALQRFDHVASPRTGVIIGGANRAFDLTPATCAALAEDALRQGGGTLAAASRRTGGSCRQALAQAFAGQFFDDGLSGAEGYMDVLAAADRFIVSGDSVNLLSEACAAGKPVHVFLPPQKNARAARKFLRFHEALYNRGLARPWRGAFEEWTPPPFDETSRAAARVWDLYDMARDTGEARGIRL